jgi:predicted DNA-binding protein (MmcQ/YjbR family)
MLDRVAARAACLALPGAVEEFPFTPDVAVFKVGGKVFALVPEAEESISLKCDPELGRSLREQHPAVRPGYHLDKRHWITIDLDGSLADGELHGLIEHSHDLVVASLPRARREAL